MKEIRVGILGQGRSGYGIHACAIAKLPECYEIVAVADAIPERRDRARAEFGCDVYGKPEELLVRSDIDLIVNATPSQMHVPLSKKFLDNGFHVLCEKPLTACLADAESLVAKGREKGKLLAVFHQHRFSPYFRQMKKVIDSGVLGRVVMFKVYETSFARRWDWQTLREFNGGSLLNNGVHLLDMALQIYGSSDMPMVKCCMDSANSFGDAEDHVKVLLQRENRPVIDLEVSSCCAYPGSTFQIYATCGGLTGSDEHMEWKYFKPEEAPEQRIIKTAMDGYCSEDLKWYEESWDLPAEQGDWDTSMKVAYYENLYRAITEGTPLEVKPEQVLQQVAALEECLAQNGVRCLACAGTNI